MKKTLIITVAGGLMLPATGCGSEEPAPEPKPKPPTITPAALAFVQEMRAEDERLKRVAEAEKSVRVVRGRSSVFQLGEHAVITVRIRNDSDMRLQEHPFAARYYFSGRRVISPLHDPSYEVTIPPHSARTTQLVYKIGDGEILLGADVMLNDQTVELDVK